MLLIILYRLFVMIIVLLTESSCKHRKQKQFSVVSVMFTLVYAVRYQHQWISLHSPGSNIAVLTQSLHLGETFDQLFIIMHEKMKVYISFPLSFCHYQRQQFTIVLVLLNQCSGPLSAVRFVNMDMMCEHVVCKQVCG